MVDDCLLKGCDLSFTDKSFNIRCPSHLVALALKRSTKDLAKWALSFKKSSVLIFSPDYPSPYHVSASMANLEDEQEIKDNKMIMPTTEIDLNQSYNSNLPEYITSLKTATVLWFNPAAMMANQKTFQQLQGFNAMLLSEPNEITRRYERLESGEVLREYEYRGYRWFYDEDTKLFLRKQMNFFSKFEPINNFYNENCYHSIVLNAEPTGTIFR